MFRSERCYSSGKIFEIIFGEAVLAQQAQILFNWVNMVRAGVVKHLTQWEFCGNNEIQSPRKRKGIINFDRLMGLLGFENYDDLKDAHYKWVDCAMQADSSGKENKWTQSIAVGSKTFIEKMKESLGFRAKGRKIICADDTFELREVLTP
jgi:putative transposase